MKKTEKKTVIWYQIELEILRIIEEGKQDA